MGSLSVNSQHGHLHRPRNSVVVSLFGADGLDRRKRGGRSGKVDSGKPKPTSHFNSALICAGAAEVEVERRGLCGGAFISPTTDERHWVSQLYESQFVCSVIATRHAANSSFIVTHDCLAEVLPDWQLHVQLKY